MDAVRLEVRVEMRTPHGRPNATCRDKTAARSRVVGLVLAAWTAAFAQSPAVSDDDPVDILMRLRDQVLAQGQRIPNYTCVETMQRDHYEPVDGPPGKSCDALLARRKQADFPSRLVLETTDRLRLDVTLAHQRGIESEIFSWAGAKRFEEGEIDQWIPPGALGTGPFASLLLSVFQIRTPRFVFEGEIVLSGRRIFEYSFAVSEEQSHYRVKAGAEWIVTGYTGTLLVDPRAAELVRFTVRTEELPAKTNLCEVDTAMDYGKVMLGGIDFLLPAATRQRHIDRDGSEWENDIGFSSCREFQAESAVEFGMATPSAGRISDTAPIRLPAGLPVIVDITTPIYCDRAAAGDRIAGRLEKAVLDGHRQATLAPEGAVLEGRLMRVETHHAKPADVTIAVRWETIEIQGMKVPLRLVPDRRTDRLLTAAGQPVPGLQSRREVVLPNPGEGRYGVYHFPGEAPIVPSGFRTLWLTAGE